MLFRSLILGTSKFPPLRRLVTKSKLFRPLVRRFVAGETLDDAISAAETECEKGLFVSLDLLGENVATETEATQARRAYEEIIDRIAASPHKSEINISIKLTALGLDQGDEVAERNFRTLLSRAAQHDIFVRADMEASEYTERTIAMIERVFPDFANTGTVLQSYLHRTPGDVTKMIDLGARVRIVKGAYLEPASVAHQEKERVDQEYLIAAKRLLKDGHYPAIATQDQAIIEELKQFVVTENIAKDSFEWQMLYGIRRDLQEGLRKEGFNVRVYIPYGDQWYPYFTRRLAERPANLLFIIRSTVKG
ncbi:MAG: proline dehydrogenase family protein [Fimbriimonadaceae bacterium]|nr:proline dehydrogenase family protein [Fimbriimonadaceae bacterium]